MKEYRNVAIARSKHDVVQFAIIEELSGSVVAVAKSKGGIYDVHFIDCSPSAIKMILEYLEEEREYFQNF